MTIETVVYLNEWGELREDCPVEMSPELLERIYRVMTLTRHVDERMIILQRQGEIPFALSSLGEEACAVVSAAALEPQDWLYPQYREVGLLFWRGGTIEDFVHHMFGNAKDSIYGRQMPNHFGSRVLNIVTVSSPIGTKIPHAAGCAYAMKLQGESAVAVSYFGEGATSEGDFHAGLNFAAVRKAPAIFFCRNNGFAISTPCKNQFACDGIAVKGIGYGMPAIRFDGNDVFATYAAVKQAREHCISGQGPVLLEAMTYRLGAHSTSDDPTRYRQEQEVEQWRGRCPILRLRRYLEKHGLWDEQKEAELIRDCSAQVDAAISAAKNTPPPPVESLFDHVYFEPTPHLKQQRADLLAYYRHRR